MGFRSQYHRTRSHVARFWQQALCL